MTEKKKKDKRLINWPFKIKFGNKTQKPDKLNSFQKKQRAKDEQWLDEFNDILKDHPDI